MAASIRPDPQAKGLGEYLRRGGPCPGSRPSLRAGYDRGGSDPGPGPPGRILAAAADLVASSGYHAVSMADIGAAAGITGSGIYRHFDRKSAVLVALFDQVIDDLFSDNGEILAGPRPARRADAAHAGQVRLRRR